MPMVADQAQRRRELAERARIASPGPGGGLARGSSTNQMRFESSRRIYPTSSWPSATSHSHAAYLGYCSKHLSHYQAYPAL